MSLLRRLPLVSFIAMASGFALSLAFPGWNMSAAVWLWLYPLLAALWLREASKKKVFFLGYLAGLTFFVSNLPWLRHSSRVINGAYGDEWMGIEVESIGWAAVGGMSFILAIYFGVWSLIAGTIAKPRREVLQNGSRLAVSLESLRCAFVAACAWVTLEWLRGWVLTGFGWNGLGVALHNNLALIQVADIVGIAGLSFLPVFASCVLFIMVWRTMLHSRSGQRFRWHFDLLVVMIVLCAQLVYGIRRLGEPAPPSTPVKVALMQLNVPQVDMWRRTRLVETYQRFADFTRLYGEARDGRPSPVDLIVWPESALQLPFEHPDHAKFFNDLLALGDFSLMTGCDFERTETSPARTSATLLSGSYKAVQIYHKVHLVPFGEYLPLRHSVPLMATLLGGMLPGDFAPGTRTEPLQLAKPDVQAIPLICFEDTDGDLARRFVRPKAQLLVNMTNDGWFLKSSEPEQHTINAIFRAVELRRPMVRACNTGVTCVIDDRGRIVASLRDLETGSTFIEGVLPGTVQVPTIGEITIYAKYGDWFAIACLLIVVTAAAVQTVRRFLLRHRTERLTSPT
jgi:apolipoprotein N-acyltransferase